MAGMQQANFLPPNAPLKLVFDELNHQLPDFALCVIQLCQVIRSSEHTDLDALAGVLRASVSGMKLTSISVVAGLDNLVRYMTRKEAVACVESSYMSQDEPVDAIVSDEDLKSSKRLLLERAKEFSLMTTWAYGTIPMLAEPWIEKICQRKRTILVHGSSRIVLQVLKMAASSYKVFCTVGSPSQNGLIFCGRLQEHGIFTQMLSDTAVAYHLSDVDMVLVGANGVDESGGIISQIGTLQIATLAYAARVPVLVAAESFKFGVAIPEKVAAEDGTPEYDYTPPKLLTHIISDSGVLSPFDIKGELTRLYTGRFSLF